MDLRRMSYSLEKIKNPKWTLELTFTDTQCSWEIYLTLRKIFSLKDPSKIEQELPLFFTTSLFSRWEGRQVFLKRHYNIFKKRSLSFTNKGLNYIIPETYQAWRAAIRELRRKKEELKAHFTNVIYLLLMNPLNMKRAHRINLRNYLKEFPWLRSYRKILVKFYYQFRQPPEMRTSLRFLSQLLTEQTHPRLKAAVKTLIENEDKIFRYQQMFKVYPKIKTCKSVKVVNESNNKIINQLYQIQCGMRTVENLRMRISKRLKCPIIISPTLIEQLN